MKFVMLKSMGQEARRNVLAELQRHSKIWRHRCHMRGNDPERKKELEKYENQFYGYSQAVAHILGVSWFTITGEMDKIYEFAEYAASVSKDPRYTGTLKQANYARRTVAALVMGEIKTKDQEEKTDKLKDRILQPGITLQDQSGIEKPITETKQIGGSMSNRKVNPVDLIAEHTMDLVELDGKWYYYNYSGLVSAGRHSHKPVTVGTLCERLTAARREQALIQRAIDDMATKIAEACGIDTESEGE